MSGGSKTLYQSLPVRVESCVRELGWGPNFQRSPQNRNMRSGRPGPTGTYWDPTLAVVVVELLPPGSSYQPQTHHSYHQLTSHLYPVLGCLYKQLCLQKCVELNIWQSVQSWLSAITARSRSPSPLPPLLPSELTLRRK